jgi:non-heme chloroperoxidase
MRTRSSRAQGVGMSESTAPAAIPLVFIHGLWLHASTWDSWVTLFNQNGYQAIAPGWPGDSATPAKTRQNAQAVANRGVGEITDHYARVLAELPSEPIVIGHSVGGLIAQRLLGQGLARAGVVIAPAQFRGVWRLPFVQLRTAWPVLGNPRNKRKAVSQTPEQFYRGFANAVSREESDELHERYAIPAPALPLFEAGLANLPGKTDATVDVRRQRGPLLIIAGGADRTVPAATVRSAYKRYRRNPSVTELKVLDGRSHSQPVDHGWHDVAGYALDFLARNGFAPGTTHNMRNPGETLDSR